MSDLGKSLVNRMQIAPTLSDCEYKIERAVFAYAEAGDALRTIRDAKLYKETHRSFEAYCRERWGWSRSYVHRTIEAGAVHDTLYEQAKTLPIGNTLEPPRNEATARELAPLRNEPKVLTEVWAEVVQKHGPDATARQVRRVVAEVLPPEGKPEKKFDAAARNVDGAVRVLRSMLHDGYELSILKQALETIEREHHV